MFKALFIWVLDLFPRIRNRIKRKLTRIPEFNQSEGKSDSQVTFYVESLKENLSNKTKLRKFRRPYDYREILEHVGYNLGKQYLSRIFSLYGDRTFEIILKNKANDDFGKPIKYKYKKIGQISPTTLRYVATALEINKEVGIQEEDRIAEIGIGYGGQAAVLARTFGTRDVAFFDLPDVIKLAETYLREIHSELKPRIGNLDADDNYFDLVISNYAFSELSRDLQEEYLAKVLLRSKRGYMIMNSGRTNLTGRSTGKLGLTDLLKVLPNPRVLEEIPKTGPDNYVLVWSNS